MVDRFKSSTGKPYSQDKWLDNHHVFKSRLRSELVQKIDLHAGDKVLDIGCGTDNWTFMLADRIGHTGSVEANDLDAEAVEIANSKRYSHHHRARSSFEQLSIFDLNEVHKYDAIVSTGGISRCGFSISRMHEGTFANS